MLFSLLFSHGNGAEILHFTIPCSACVLNEGVDDVAPHEPRHGNNV